MTCDMHCYRHMTVIRVWGEQSTSARRSAPPHPMQLQLPPAEHLLQHLPKHLPQHLPPHQLQHLPQQLLSQHHRKLQEPVHRYMGVRLTRLLQMLRCEQCLDLLHLLCGCAGVYQSSCHRTVLGENRASASVPLVPVNLSVPLSVTPARTPVCVPYSAPVSEPCAPACVPQRCYLHDLVHSLKKPYTLPYGSYPNSPHKIAYAKIVGLCHNPKPEIMREVASGVCTGNRLHMHVCMSVCMSVCLSVCIRVHMPSCCKCLRNKLACTGNRLHTAHCKAQQVQSPSLNVACDPKLAMLSCNPSHTLCHKTSPLLMQRYIQQAAVAATLNNMLLLLAGCKAHTSEHTPATLTAALRRVLCSVQATGCTLQSTAGSVAYSLCQSLLPTSTAKLYWTLDTSKSPATLTAAMDTTTSGSAWLGFGFPASEGQMLGGSAVIAQPCSTCASGASLTLSDAAQLCTTCASGASLTLSDL